MEREQAVCGQCGTMSADCMVYAFCPKCEEERRTELESRASSPEAEALVETAEEALDCKHIMGNADCSCQDDTDLGDLCRAVRAYRITFPKKVECICHETVVGKDECPVHGKHPTVPEQGSTKKE